jgi:predicted GIY-YIG superfamily endonuclease
MMKTHVLYRFFDAANQLLYVGITASPPRRFNEHRTNKEWWTQVNKITIENYSTRSGLQAAERHAITTEQPRYNVLHNAVLHSSNTVEYQTDSAQQMPNVENLIHAAHAVLNACDITHMSASKIHRLARGFKQRAPQANIRVFLLYLADKVQMTARQQQNVMDIARLMMPYSYGNRDSRRRHIRHESASIIIPLGATTGIPLKTETAPVFPVYTTQGGI